MISPDSMSTDIMITRLGRFASCSAPRSGNINTARRAMTARLTAVALANVLCMEFSLLDLKYEYLRLLLAVLRSRDEVPV